jgi:transcription elongation GreA/GreB family factor
LDGLGRHTVPLPMTLKEKLHQHCLLLIKERLSTMQKEMQSLQDSANQETKSSAGDKYETGRAMAQLEIERLFSQRHETEKLLHRLQSFNQEMHHDHVQPGSVVTTTSATFYIAISLGTVALDGTDHFVISPESPIAKQLLGKHVGDAFSWQKNNQIILSIA